MSNEIRAILVISGNKRLLSRINRFASSQSFLLPILRQEDFNEHVRISVGVTLQGDEMLVSLLGNAVSETDAHDILSEFYNIVRPLLSHHDAVIIVDQNQISDALDASEKITAFARGHKYGDYPFILPRSSLQLDLENAWLLITGLKFDESYAQMVHKALNNRRIAQS